MLKQTDPMNGLPVCPGERLVYECITSLRVTWEEDGFVESFLFSSEVHMPRKAVRFEFELTNVINETILISTATIPMTRPNDTGIELRCIEDVVGLVEFVSVLDGPDNCNGDISCSLSPDGSNINVSFNHLTEGNCIVGYLFQLDQQNKTSCVNKSFVLFPIQEVQYSQHLNQKVYTVDSEGRLGEIPCLYNINAPNAVKGISFSQSCNGPKIDLTVHFERPEFPLGSCFDADNMTWEYHYSISDVQNTSNVTHIMTTDKDDVLVHDVQPGIYEVVVMPSAVELGLNGSVSSATIVVNVICEAPVKVILGEVTVADEPSSVIIYKMVLADCELPSDIGSEGTDRVTQPFEETSNDENQSAVIALSILFVLFFFCTVAHASLSLALIFCPCQKRKANLEVHTRNPAYETKDHSPKHPAAELTVAVDKKE